MFRQLQPDVGVICFDECKEPLCNWLPALVIRIVALMKFRGALPVVCGHGCVDYLRGEITFYSKGFYGLLSDARRLLAANPLEGIYYRRVSASRTTG
jgi:hypothetical protein